jgi:5-formyltetrahydrofolate cyclo-ligase
MNIEPRLQIRKSELRSRVRQQRARIAHVQRQAWDSAINRHVVEYAERTSPRLVAAFIAFDGEPDLRPALERLARQRVRLALPVVLDEPTRPVICFRQWSPTSEMRPNRYGIPEPVGTLDVQLAEVDLALIPLVAWDRAGGRLGMGASFYDRLLQPLAEQSRPVRMGVAYQLQEVEQVPADPWDIRLHGVLTEQGCSENLTKAEQ